MNALFLNWRLGKRVGVVNGVEKRREGVVAQAVSNTFELGGGHCESIAVDELVEGSDDSLLEIVS